MNATAQQLVEIGKKQLEGIEKLTQTIEKQTREVQANRAHLESLELQIKKLNYTSEVSVKQVACHEKRYCELAGEGTDMARMVDFFCRAESAVVSSHSLEIAVREIVDKSSSRALEYQVLFGQKDNNRAEASAVMWYLTFKLGRVLPTSDLSTGILGQYMPSFRAKCMREFEHQRNRGMHEDLTPHEFLEMWPTLDRDLRIVHQLVLPMGTNFEPLSSSESRDIMELRRQARNMSIERTWSVEGSTEIDDLRDKSVDELYEMLSPEAKEFFTSCPTIEATEDKSLRVTKALSSWKFYMDEVE